MQFPNAYRGVKKIFIAELLAIAAAALGIVSAILLMLPGEANANNPAAVAAGAIVGAAAVIALVGFIFQMIGTHQAGKDEGSFRVAFWVIIASIVLTIVSTVLKTWVPGTGTLTTVLDAIASISNVVVMVYIISGISILAARLNNERMARLGRTLTLVILLLFVVDIILGVIPTFVPNPSSAATTAFGVFGIIEAVISLVVYIVFFVYLMKAVKMLKE